jgi:hypothetical protein
MYLFPSLKKHNLVLRHDSHRSPDICPCHSIGPDQFGFAVPPAQIYLGLSVSKDMHMRRFVIVHKDDDPQAVRAMDRDHDSFNLSR